MLAHFGALALALLAAAPCARAELPPGPTWLEAKYGRTDVALRAHSGKQVAQWVQIPVDHFGNATAETYQNRYWVNGTYYKPGGPVFVFDAGEGDAEPFVSALEESGQQLGVMQLARQYHGIGILWEHRYYGKSLPFASELNQTGNWTAEQWSFLTVTQALEDVVFFASNFTPPASAGVALAFPEALHAANAPWVFVGGSYPGVRAALLRVRSPGTIFASWASSAPVQAQVNMTSYWEAVERALPRNCSADYVAVTRWTDGVLSGTNRTAIDQLKYGLVKARLMNQTGETPESRNLTVAAAAQWDDLDAALILTDPMSNFQNNGLDDVFPFCDIIETLNGTAAPTAAGVNATRGPEPLLAAFQAAIAHFNYDPDVAVTPLPSADSWDRQWCSEFGFFQAGNASNPQNILTARLTLDVIQESCHQEFAENLPATPDVQHVLQFGGWGMSPPRVMFTNGALDPWRTLSVGSLEYNAPGRSPSADIPGPDAGAPAGAFFGLTYAQQVHAADLLDWPGNAPGRRAAFRAGLDLFNASLAAWLPAFAPAVRANAGVPGARPARLWSWVGSAVLALAGLP